MKRSKTLNKQTNINSNIIQQWIEDFISPQVTHCEFVSAKNLDNPTSPESLNKDKTIR